jgi:hypothetical protein
MATEKQDNQTDDNISWHPAFFEAIRLELAQYGDVLQFIAEYPLNTEPLRIDVVIKKTPKDIPITKNIASIFRKHNLVEYKSPTDHLSISDFKKVYAYGYLYMALNKIEASDLTLTFVESRHPQKLLTYLTKVRHYHIDERIPGIYLVEGEIFAVQIVDSSKLAAADNLWLKGLNNKLDIEQMNQILNERARVGQKAQTDAYINAIFRANPDIVKELHKMGRLTLDQVFIETGLAAEWEARGEARGKAEGEARGEARGKAELARNLVKLGVSFQQIAQAADMDIEAVKSLIQPV